MFVVTRVFFNFFIRKEDETLVYWKYLFPLFIDSLSVPVESSRRAENVTRALLNVPISIVH